jgi:cytochrome c5
MMDKGQDDGLFSSPKKLIVAMVLGFLLPVVLCILVAQMVVAGRQGSAGSEQAVGQRVQPVAQVDIAEAAGAMEGAAQSGEAIYNVSCLACHSTGAAGAPKVGDASAWQPRLAQGLEALVHSAVVGKNAMPAKGGAANLSDDDIRRAVIFMGNKSGANF